MITPNGEIIVSRTLPKIQKEKKALKLLWQKSQVQRPARLLEDEKVMNWKKFYMPSHMVQTMTRQSQQRLPSKMI